MEMNLDRVVKTSDSTIGELSINGKFECYTLEDPVREKKGAPVEQWKIKGDTAIPTGRYKVIINMSSRFKQNMPLLLNVPGFSGIRMHSGNTSDDTEGCLLVGTTKGNNVIGNSRLAFSVLFTKLSEALSKNEAVWITIK